MVKEGKESEEKSLGERYQTTTKTKLTDKPGATRKPEERKLKRPESKRDKEDFSLMKKRKSGECEHRYRVLAISGGLEHLKCMLCGKIGKR